MFFLLWWILPTKQACTHTKKNAFGLLNWQLECCLCICIQSRCSCNCAGTVPKVERVWNQLQWCDLAVINEAICIDMCCHCWRVCVYTQSRAVNSLGGRIRSGFALYCKLSIKILLLSSTPNLLTKHYVPSDCHACIENIAMCLSECAWANVYAGSYRKRSTPLKLASAFVMPVFVCALLVSVMFVTPSTANWNTDFWISSQLVKINSNKCQILGKE